MSSINERLARSTVNLFIALEVIALIGRILDPQHEEVFYALGMTGLTVFACSAFFAFRVWREARSDSSNRTAEAFEARVPSEPVLGVAVRDALSEHYIRFPDGTIPKGKLPQQEIEVRQALLRWRGALSASLSASPLDSLFRPFKVRKLQRLASESEREVRTLVASSQEHRAALCRLVNATPMDHPARNLMSSFLADISG